MVMSASGRNGSTWTQIGQDIDGEAWLTTQSICKLSRGSLGWPLGQYITTEMVAILVTPVSGDGMVLPGHKWVKT